jgi:hypothetical protein
MKILSLEIILILAALHARGQGTLIYDQQSSIEAVPGEGYAILQVATPLGQSFTPSLGSVGFVRLQFFDWNNNNGQGAAVYVNLRSNSVTGPVLAASVPVFMPDGFGVAGGGFTNFLFPSPVSVTPGVTYFLEIPPQSGDVWALRGTVVPTPYAGGTEYIGGNPVNGDLWFQEGVVVPEPQSSALLLLGIGLFFYARHFQTRKKRERKLFAH